MNGNSFIVIFLIGLAFVWLSCILGNKKGLSHLSLASFITAVCLIIWAGLGALNVIGKLN